MVSSKRIKKHRKRRTLKRVRHVGGSKCIFVKLIKGEGLGNQLYIYAAALLVQKKNNIPICMLPTEENIHSKRDYRTMFNVNLINLNDNNYSKRINDAKECLLLKGDTDKWGINDILDSDGDIKLPFKLYQNYESIASVIPDVKNSLFTKEFNKDLYKEYKDKITNPKSTAFVHIRRGDKIARGWAVGEDYYSKGITELDKNPNISTIYIFSNDIEWAKLNDELWKKATQKPIIYYNNDDELIVLYMMILCEAGAVEGNSTYSSWGAMLGADMNPKSTIVHKKNPPEYPNIENPFNFPSNWIGIK